MAAKEELEVNQIEAVYRLTTANKKMEAELVEVRYLPTHLLASLESGQMALGPNFHITCSIEQTEGPVV